ncbi:MAG: response regulator transcription factor [Bryobacterales bacterium]
MISVCLCDPQPVVHEGLRVLLEHSDDLSLADAVEDLRDAIDMAADHRPDVVIFDRSFGMHSVLESVAELRAKGLSAKVVIWAASISDVECFRAIQAGARGIMKKTVEPEALYHCLRTVAGNQLWTENLYETRDMPLERPRSRPLTPREQEVAALVAKGMKNREIAETLGIATGTVKIHLMHIFEKTGIRDRFELALHGLRRTNERERSSRGASQDDRKSALAVS